MSCRMYLSVFLLPVAFIARSGCVDCVSSLVFIYGISLFNFSECLCTNKAGERYKSKCKHNISYLPLFH